jgi:hypothetical protein
MILVGTSGANKHGSPDVNLAKIEQSEELKGNFSNYF